MPPPFNAKEVARFFLWIVIIAVAVGIIVWFIFYGSGRKSIQSSRNGAALPGESLLQNVL